jgi:lantibiotic biosynthesis protein
LGLSHGIPSILVFLVKCYIYNINSKKSYRLIRGIVNYLLNNTQDSKKYNSYFSYSVKEDNFRPEKSRLAWCYGDLGVCCSLWQALFVINDKSLKEKIIEIMLFNTNRRTLEDNLVLDAGFCHGTAGIAHIFNRFYNFTFLNEFKEASIYWYDETIKMAKYDDGFAGYKSKSKGNLYEKNMGLFEGVSGTGLSLITAISTIEPSWDEIFLIS